LTQSGLLRSGDGGTLLQVQNDNSGDENDEGDADEPLTGQFDPLMDSDDENEAELEAGQSSFVWRQVPIIESPVIMRRNVHPGQARHVASTAPEYSGPPRGPVNVPRGTESVLDFWRIFYTDAILDTFVAATNAYANNTKKAKWCDLTRNELIIFFGLITFMGSR
jgi:hypothetical protein